MCLGMANGYRVPGKENINESPKTNVKTIIEKTEEQLKKAENDGEKIYLSAFLDGAKAQKEEYHFLMKALFPETEVWERRLQEKDQQIQKLINEVAYLKRKLSKSPENSQYEAWQQACRQRWRALKLVIQAKLEAVECGISVFEEEFMANIVLPGGQTVGDFMKPQIEQAYLSGAVPKLLPMLEG